jgi:hypothetical protein
MSNMRILVKMIYPLGIQTTGPAFYTMHFLALFKKKFGQIRSILTSNSSNKSNFHEKLVWFFNTSPSITRG